MNTNERRLASVEELMHTSQMTIGNVLERLKEVELLVSQALKSQASNDALSSVGRELVNTKQRLEVVERSWRMGVQKLEDDFHTQAQQAGARHQQQMSQAKNEIQEMRQGLSELSAELHQTDGKLNDEARQIKVVSEEARTVKQNEQSTRQDLGEVREQVLRNRETLLQKLDGVSKHIAQEAADRDTLVSSTRAALEASLQGFAEQAAQRAELEATKRVKLAEDVVTAFKKLRDEVSAGFQRTGQSQQEVEKALRTVEGLLRAEIRNRMKAHDAAARKLAGVDKRAANDAQVLADAFRELDQVLKETRTVLSADYRTSLEKLAERVRDLQEDLAETAAAVAAKPRHKPRGVDDDHDGAALGKIRKELSGLKDDTSVLENELQKLRVLVTGARSNGVDEERLREVTDLVTYEREDLTRLIQRSVQREREYCDDAAKQLQNDNERRFKDMQASVKQVKDEVRQLQVAHTNTNPSPTFQKTPAEFAHLRADLDELVGIVESLAEGMRQNTGQTRAPAASDPKKGSYDKASYVGMLFDSAGFVAPVDDARLGALEARVGELESLKGDVNNLGRRVSRWVDSPKVVDGAGDGSVVALMGVRLKEAEEKIAETKTGIRKDVEALQQMLTQATDELRQEGQTRHEETFEIREMLEHVINDRLHAQQTSPQVQDQLDDLRRTVAQSEDKQRELQRLFRDQVSDCLKAHADHGRTGKLHASDIEALKTSLFKMQQDAKSRR
ncbi:hypothetical protein DIPPA_07182 [Diplonema papillatum]|nr:hypothetical protein DIPPA_07182 [Diplonema papillatum]